MVPHRQLIFIAAMMASAGRAGAQDIKPRTIEPGRIIAAGEFAPLKPRTIAPGSFIAAGEYFPVKPRIIQLPGWTASPPRGKKQ